MGIFSGILGTGNIQNNIQTDSNAVNKLPEADLSGNQVGDTLNGKIVKLGNEGALVELPDGSVINCRLDNTMQLSVGMSVTLEFKGISGSQITLSPLYMNMESNSVAAKALMSAGMPVNNTTVEMTEAMISGKMNISSDSLGEMYHYINEYSDVKPAYLVEMKQLGLEINSDNVTRFDAFKNYENTITDGINDVINELKGVITSEGGISADAPLIKSIIDTFVGSPNTEGVSNGGEAGENSLEQMQLEAAKSAPDNETAAAGNILSKTGIEGELAFPDGENINNSTVNKAGTGEIPGNDTGSVLPKALVNTDNYNVNDDVWHNMTASEKSEVVKFLKEAGVGNDKLLELYENTSDGRDVFRAVSHALEDGMNEPLKNLLKSEKFGKIFDSTIKNQWLLNPEETSDKNTVGNLYKRLNTQVRNILNELEQVMPGRSNEFTGISNLNQNIDFMNAMNNVYQYIQLPLKMNGDMATGDLYVYTNKKGNFDDGTVSALLHLDMANLGPVDVYAAIKDNNVSTRFYLKDDETIDFISANIHILNERLEKRGYNMTSSIVNRDELGGPKQDDVLIAKNTLGNKDAAVKMGFDMRA